VSYFGFDTTIKTKYMRRAKHLHRHLHLYTRRHKHQKHKLSDLTIYKTDTLGQKIQKTWARFGPGIITGASDDDPSGITTYSQAGANFGLHTLWMALVSFPLMASIQEMCGRIGLVTGKGLTSVVKAHYPKWLIYLIGFVSVPAIILNIAADLAGMGAVSNMIFPIIPAWVFTILSALAIIFSVILFSYKKLESVLKWLSLVLLVYLIVPFLVKQDWLLIFKSTVIPHFEFTKEFIVIVVAILGTTISPYLFFWEASIEVEEHQENTRLELKKAKTSKELKTDLKGKEDSEYLEVTPAEIKTMREDNNLGMLISNVAMFFIILTAGTVLFPNGVTQINTVQDAAAALKPIAGDFAYILFAVGVIGTGFLAVPVLAGACGYIISEMFDWKEGMNNKFKQARGFYEVIAFSILLGLGLNISGMDPVQSLIWAAVVYGVTAPIMIGIILHIANRKDIMGKWKNGWLANTLGGIGLVLMVIAAIALIYSSIAG
jgi:NRAMP (natural resistance-associated macrophage protein)-like metal ion transporter